MSGIDPGHRSRQRRGLIALALLFFAPLALAFILYYGVGWRPGGRLNHGDLVEPPVPLPDLALPDAPILRGKWTLLYFGPGSCPAGCRSDLYNTRQVRAALGADRERVQRVFLAEGECCDLEWLRVQQPDLIMVRASAATAPLAAILEHAARGPAPADRVYLIDPLGNLMMSYALDARPKGMLEDLKKLLRLSQVG